MFYFYLIKYIQVYIKIIICLIYLNVYIINLTQSI